jgi:hypothetical protein
MARVINTAAIINVAEIDREDPRWNGKLGN